MRVGLGVDAHPFEPGRSLILGGVLIGGSPGLAGHSDADVVCHALCDALLGAAGMGDIGEHFPDDVTPAGAASLGLLSDVALDVISKGFRVESIDTVICAQEVRIAPHRDDMRRNIATALAVHPDLVSVKATTTDRLGFIGRQEGIAALAVALIDGPRAERP